MSLIAWYPLNGNLNGQGLVDISWTNHNATVDNNGKIGKCYKFESLTGDGISASDNGFMDNYINNKSFTICAWVKSSSRNTIIISLSYGIRLYSGITPTASLYNSSRTVTATNPTSTNDNKWHHIALTYDKDSGEILCYVDAVAGSPAYYPAEYTYSSSWKNGLYIGADPNDTSEQVEYRHFIGSMNDVRIYDECLSQKEIKEISKALVLHYPMNQIDGYIGGRNLVAHSNYDNKSEGNSITLNKWGGNEQTCVIEANTPNSLPGFSEKRVCTASSGGGGYHDIGSFFLQAGKTYTLSFYAKGLTNYVMQGYLCCLNRPSDNLYLLNTDNYTINNKWTRYSRTITISASNEGTYTIRSIIYNISTISLSHFKVEEGSVATPWTPAPEDGVVTSFDNTIYNVSGFGNNGTVTDSTCPGWSNDAVIGQGSYKFSSGQGINGGVKKYNTETLTITSWVKLDSYCSSDTDRSAIYIGGGYLTINSDGRLSVYAYGKNPAGYHNGSHTIPLNTWTHLAVTWSETHVTGYVNGVQDLNIACSGTIDANYYLTIGKEESMRQLFGNIQDLRIYTTALSPEDIKELCETRYSIANNGTLFCNSIVENNDVDLTNLVFNGDLKFVDGTVAKGFSTSYNTSYGGIKVLYDGLGCLTQVPLKYGCTYRYSFDFYITSWNITDRFFMAILSYSNKNQQIYTRETNRVGRDGDTTLASPIQDGDTTATIVINGTINSTWNSLAVHQYSNFCIFDSLAWGYNKASYVGPKITGYSNGVVTFATAWSGGTISAGTKVGITRDSDTYVYPYFFAPSQDDIGKWKTCSGTFTCDSRYSMRYARPHILNYGQEVYLKNIRIENITETQLLDIDNCRNVNLSDGVKFPSNGQINALCVKDSGLDIRYIRDYLNGSTANNHSHWVAIQAFNSAENNCCWGIIPTASTSMYHNPLEIITVDGNHLSSDGYIYATGNQYVQIDLATIRNIKKLKIWHYYADGRQYNNKTQVSVDGTNWITVFDSDIEGKYVETAEGHTIDLTDKKFKIYSNGVVNVPKIIEH